MFVHEYGQIKKKVTAYRAMQSSMLGKNFSRGYLEIIFLFFPENRLWHFMQTVSSQETVCMNCQSLFSKKNMKNIVILSSAELAKEVLKINTIFIAAPWQIWRIKRYSRETQLSHRKIRNNHADGWQWCSAIGPGKIFNICWFLAL